MIRASEDEIAELIGEDVPHSIIERIANVGASIDEVREAIEDLEFQTRFGETRISSSPIILEVRHILEELPYFEELLQETQEGEEEHEGLTVIEPDELRQE